MKHVLPLLAVMIALASLSFGQSKPKESRLDARTEQELKNLVRLWDESYVKGDVATLDRLLADEFSFVAGWNKSEYLASIKNRTPDSTVESAVSERVEVQVYGETAVVTGLDTIKGRVKGEPSTSRWMYMDVWIKRAGRWQCVKTSSFLFK
jgi:ketosteroid isomerase-like protein